MIALFYSPTFAILLIISLHFIIFVFCSFPFSFPLHRNKSSMFEPSNPSTANTNNIYINRKLNCKNRRHRLLRFIFVDSFIFSRSFHLFGLGISFPLIIYDYIL